jgi:hypothetical protein
MSWQATLLSATEEELCCMELIEYDKFRMEAVFVHFKLEGWLLKVGFMKPNDLPCCSA